MEHEDFYGLMMDALDGELLADEQTLLESHLRACPDCMREWQAISAIDALFRRSPMLSPAADFTQRTLARLPNRRVRLWLMGLVYVALMVAGLLPVLVVVGTAVLLAASLGEPAAVNSGLQLLTRGIQLMGAVAGALLNGAARLIIDQPSIMGWMLVMVGIVFLWSGVYRQMLNVSAQRQIS
ncbi:MAG: zf-HC2 domain-containing protein [Anaerolineae bacterium]|nr:zf-HC2 domain-containing protein [Anaerolineae bacterium]